MFKWLLLLIVYLPFQIALNPRPGFDLASLRIFIVLLFVIWLGKAIFSKLRIPGVLNLVSLKGLQNIGLFIFLFLSGFSLIGAENVSWGIRKLIFFLSIFPLYFLVIALVDNWLKIKKIISILVMGSGLIALIGLVQFLSQFVFGLERVYGFWAVNIVPIFSGFNLGAMILAYPSWLVNINGETILRAFSLFSDPHMLSFYIGLILPLAIILLYQTSEKNQTKFSIIAPSPKRLWHASPAKVATADTVGDNFQFSIIFVSCFMLYVTCLLTFTRGAYFAIIVTFLVMAGLFWRYLKAKKIVLLLCLSLLIFIIPGTPIFDRFYSSFDMSDGSNIGRLEMWQQANQTGQEHFWQGVGLGNYSLLVDEDLGYRNPVTAHNLYLDIFSEIGFFGLTVWLILILGTMVQLFRQIRITKGSDPAQGQTLMRIGLIGSLVYFSVHSFFETAIYSPSILALLMIILGISTILTNKRLKLT